MGLIGAGIGESLSPALHEREAARLGLEYAYRLLDLDELGRAPEDVREMVREPARFDGFNVTHPCKQLVVAGARRAVARGGGDRRGQHVVFDGGRLRRPQHRLDRVPARRSRAGCPARPPDAVVLLGAGGAGAAVGHAACALGAA